MGGILGYKSTTELATCTPDLSSIVRLSIQLVDFSVLEGFRNETRQNYLRSIGMSKAKFGESKHNVYPSLAVDLAPYPINWSNRERFVYLAGIVLGVGWARGIRVRWGGDWDMDADLTDQTFHDLGHFELVPIVST